MFIWATFCVWRAGLCLFGLHFVFGGLYFVENLIALDGPRYGENFEVSVG